MHRFLKWRDAILLAPDYPALVALMVDYVASIPIEQRARLPQECQRVLQSADDVAGAAVTLLQTELTFRGEQEVAALLHEIAHTFASAAFRLGQLNHRDLPSAPVQ
jgi:hypothetical protein